MNKKISIDLAGMPPTEVHKLLARLNGYGIKYSEDVFGLVKPINKTEPAREKFDFADECVTPAEFDRYENLPEFRIICEILDGYMNMGHSAMHPEEELGELQSHEHINILAATILKELSSPMSARVQQHVEGYETAVIELQKRMNYLKGSIKILTKQFDQLDHDFKSLTGSKSTGTMGAPLTQDEMAKGYQGPSAEEVNDVLGAALRKSYYPDDSKDPT